MHRSPLPTLIDGILHTNASGAMPFGTAAWYAWLADESNRSFAFQSDAGSFTARRERQRNGWYWYAYRRRGRRVRKLYLGRSTDLTLERLQTTAATLAADSSVSPTSPELPAEASAAPLLLSTKLYAPSPRPEQLARPRLMERMASVWRYPLTVLTAPAGFGKTTLLTTWLALDTAAPERGRIAWIALDSGDNDPSRLLRYVVAAIDGLPDGLLADVLTLLDVPQPPPTHAVISVLINALARLPQPTALVLDDYHTITTPEIHEALAALIERMPAQFHLVIASRSEPPLGLARLRVRGQLNELRATDLRFTPDEATWFLNDTMGLQLSPDVVQALEVRTEGWIAGLQLAVLAMRDRHDHAGFVSAFAGSHRAVADYLAEEVINRQPPDVQSFLLYTAILDQLCAGLCAALLSVESPLAPKTEPDAQTMLEYLERTNLFVVPLDDDRRWYRYHQLFAEMLRDRLQRRFADLVPELHRRAARWYHTAGMLDLAISHSLSAADYAEAAQLIAAVADHVLWELNDTRRLLQWLDALPQTLLEQHPALQVAQAWALLASLRVDDAERTMRRIEHALRPNDPQTPGLRGEIATIRSFLRRIYGDIPAALNLAQTALELTPPDWERVRVMAITGLVQIYFSLGDIEHAELVVRQLTDLPGSDLLTALVPKLSLVDILAVQGRLHEAHMLVEHIRLDLGHRFNPDLPGWVMLAGAHGTLAYEWNDLDTAERCAREMIERGRRWWNNDMLINGYAILSSVMKARGDSAAARHCDERLEQLVIEYNVPNLTTQVRTGRVWRNVLDGDLQGAVRWIEMSGLRAGDDFPPYRRDEYMVLARMLIALGRTVEALPLLDRLEAQARTGKYVSLQLELLKIRMHALLQQGDHASARAAFIQALTLAEPGGYVRMFLDEGESIQNMLAPLAADPALPAQLRAYAARLLAATGRPEPYSAGSLPEPLSAREYDVLRLLAAGHTNQEIAERLVVALSTVRTHLQHIYAKLGVRNRVEAIAKARALGIIAG